MSESNVKFGQGGRLYADATKEFDGFPSDQESGGELGNPPPNKVLTKNPAGLPPASSARPGSFQEIGSTALELTGIGLISLGFFLFSPALGFIVLGLSLTLLGYILGGGR